MKKTSIIIILIFVSISGGQKKSYDGNQLWSVFVADENEAKILTDLQTSYDFWTGIRIGRHVDIHVEKGQIQHLAEYLKKAGLKSHVAVENVHRLIEREDKFMASRQGGFFETYHDSDEIQEFIFEIAANHSDAQIENIGKSYEGPSRVQRFPEVPDQSGMATLPVIPENRLLWTF